MKLLYLMKNLFYFIIFICLLARGTESRSQNIARQSGCSDSFILHQADSIKQDLIKQGFLIVKEASMAMESEYEMPVIVPLKQGEWYQFVFVGEPTSRLYEVRMFDSDEKQVFYKKHLWGDVDGNVISYTYAARFSEYHMIKPVQVNKTKKKGLCGYIMMFKKVAAAG